MKTIGRKTFFLVLLLSLLIDHLPAWKLKNIFLNNPKKSFIQKSIKPDRTCMTDLESTKEKDSVIVVGETRKSEDDFFIQNTFPQPVIGPVTGTNTDYEI